MKQILIALSLLLLATGSFAGEICPECSGDLYAWISPGVVGGGVGAAAVTYIHNIPCDDNAASTTVVNDGTKAAWAANVNTSLFGDGDKFDMTYDSGAVNVATSDWDEEAFTLILKVYINDADVTPGNSEQWFTINNDGDFSVETNEFFLYRVAAESGEINVQFKGNNAGDTNIVRHTTDWSPSVSTWYWIKLVVDASANPWSVDIYSSTDGSSYTELTWDTDTWSTGTAASWDNDNATLGNSKPTSNYGFEGYFEDVLITAD